MTEQYEIKFRDLSIALKVQVILSWIVITFFGLAFLVGFVEGILLV